MKGRIVLHMAWFVLLSILANSKSYARIYGDSANIVTPVVTPEFEKFDSLRYEKFKVPKRNYSIEVLDNGTEIKLEKRSQLPHGYYEIPEGSYFYICKIYYSNGYIKSKGLAFISGNFRKGVWYHYDEQGNLTDSIDHDEPYKFTFEQVLEFAKKEGIEYPLSPIDRDKYIRNPPALSRRVVPETGRPRWQIRYWDEKTGMRQMIINIDGITGEELGREQRGMSIRGVLQ